MNANVIWRAPMWWSSKSYCTIAIKDNCKIISPLPLGCCTKYICTLFKMIFSWFDKMVIVSIVWEQVSYINSKCSKVLNTSCLTKSSRQTADPGVQTPDHTVSEEH